MQALLSNLLELHMPALQNKLRKCLSWGKDISDEQADVAGKTSSAANLVGVNVVFTSCYQRSFPPGNVSDASVGTGNTVRWACGMPASHDGISRGSLL